MKRHRPTKSFERNSGTRNQNVTLKRERTSEKNGAILHTGRAYEEQESERKKASGKGLGGGKPTTVSRMVGHRESLPLAPNDGEYGQGNPCQTGQNGQAGRKSKNKRDEKTKANKTRISKATNGG